MDKSELKYNNTADNILLKYEKSIRYICTSLTANRKAAEDAYNQILNIAAVKSEQFFNGSGDIKTAVLKFTAEICINSNSDKKELKVFSSPAPSPDDSIDIPESKLKDYYYLSNAEMLIYYCTEKEEYRIFFMHEYIGMSAEEIAALYSSDANTITHYLNNALCKIKTSLKTEIKSSDKLIHTDMRTLMQAAAEKKPPRAIRKPVSRKELLKSKKEKMIVAASLAAIVLCLVFEICFTAVLTPQVNGNKSSDIPLDIRPTEEISYLLRSDYRPKNESRTENSLSQKKLYTQLICDKKISFEDSGLQKEQFISQSDNVTLFQILAFNTSSDMIKPEELEVKFANGSSHIKDGKLYFIYEVIPINRRTNLIQILAPGSYFPEQLRIDMSIYGEYDSSYPLPTKLTEMDAVVPDIITGDIPEAEQIDADPGEIICMYPEENKKYYCLVLSANTVSYTLTDNTYNSTVHLELIPLGSDNYEYFDMNKNNFVYNYDEGMAENYDEYITTISYKLSDSEETNSISNFSYKILFDFTINFDDSIQTFADDETIIDIGNMISNGYIVFYGFGQNAKINMKTNDNTLY